jgi:hypothetical protein
MATPSIHDLRDFHQFVGNKVNNGGALLSPEEVLDEWRMLHPDPGEVAEDVAAIQEAIDDLENGDTGIPFEEFDRSFRARHGLQPRS